jgi:hypothetical protein
LFQKNRREIFTVNKKEDVMKKYYLILLFFTMILVGLSTQVFAATIDDLVGTWNVKFNSKFAVVGKFSDSDIAYGIFAFNNDYTFSVYDIYGRTFTGTFSLINNGKKIVFVLDPSSLDEIKNVMLTDWLTEMAEEGDVYISNISFDFRKVRITNAKISKKTNWPLHALIVIKGKVSAIANGKYTIKNFSYRCKIKFI